MALGGNGVGETLFSHGVARASTSLNPSPNPYRNPKPCIGTHGVTHALTPPALALTPDPLTAALTLTHGVAH